jgi:hypothetical protein
VVHEGAQRERTLSLPAKARTLRERLNAVADAADTEWHRVSGVYVFLQRYSRWEDRLEVSHREMLQSLDDMWRVIGAVVPLPWHDDARLQMELVRSLTSDQKQALKARRTLSFSALSAEQQKLTAMVTRGNYYASTAALLESVREQIHGFPQSRLSWNAQVAASGPDGGFAIYRFPRLGVAEWRDHSISLDGLVTNDGPSANPGAERGGITGPAPARGSPRLWEGSGTKKPLGKSVSLQLRNVPFAEAVKRLEEAAAISVRLPAEASATDKKVTVQASSIDVHVALDALAAVYDWEWRRVKEGEYRISRPAIRLPQRVEEFPLLLFRALPRTVRSNLLNDPGARRGQVASAYLARLMRELKPALVQREIPVRQLAAADQRLLRDGLFYHLFQLFHNLDPRVSPVVQWPERITVRVQFEDESRNSGMLFFAATGPDGRKGETGFGFSFN